MPWCRFSPDYFRPLTARLPGKWYVLSVHREAAVPEVVLGYRQDSVPLSKALADAATIHPSGLSGSHDT
jgi:hypothetical protein